MVTILFTVGLAFPGCTSVGSPFFNFMGAAFAPLCCVGVLKLAAARAAALVRRGLLAVGLGWVWPSASPLRGGFGIFGDSFKVGYSKSGIV